MVIALIFWKIRPTDVAVEQFKTWWRDKAQIHDRSGLGGEFLSSPIPAGELPFDSDDLCAPNGEYRAFVNVGLWRDKEDFIRQVGQYIDDEGPLHEFEAQPRSRTLLTAEVRRMGEWHLA